MSVIVRIVGRQGCVGIIRALYPSWIGIALNNGCLSRLLNDGARGPYIFGAAVLIRVSIAPALVAHGTRDLGSHGDSTSR
mgnify:FL=1